jgi:hypothetical protein
MAKKEKPARTPVEVGSWVYPRGRDYQQGVGRVEEKHGAYCRVNWGDYDLNQKQGRSLNCHEAELEVMVEPQCT